MSENNVEVNELVESAASYSGSLYNGLDKVVGHLRTDKIHEGLSLLSQGTEGIDWLINSVTILNQTGGKYGGFETEEMSNFLSEMLEAVENTDYVLLADLIEYEILPIVDTWGKKLDTLLEDNN